MQLKYPLLYNNAMNVQMFFDLSFFFVKFILLLDFVFTNLSI